MGSPTFGSHQAAKQVVPRYSNTNSNQHCQSETAQGNGYDVYDIYDLGEFDQKGSRATKWGTKDELLELSSKGKEIGIGLYWDAVLNHKAAADKKEKVRVVEVDSNGV